MPKASVIIATYNWSSVLPYSIGSVLEQTESDLEVIVVGDACTDDSEQVVHTIADPRVSWFNLNERFGHQGGPNNEGIRRARGEYIFYLGHDDVWFPHHVGEYLARFEQGDDVVYGICAMIDTEGNAKMAPSRPTPFRKGMWIPPSCLAHRRSIVERAGLWGDYREVSDTPEIDFMTRMLETGGKVGFCPRLTVVKFPAIRRPGVYLTKPFQEQREWLGRIRSDNQLEAKLLGRIVDSTSRKRDPVSLKADVLRVLRRVLRRVVRRGKNDLTVRAKVDAAKRLKGSDP